MTPELEHYLQFFEDLHGQIEALIKELPLEAVNWRPLEGQEGHAINSVAVLVTHITGAEQYWIGELLGQRPVNRNRDAEFQAVAESIPALCQRLAEAGNLIRQVLTTVDPARLEEVVQVRDHSLTLRWGVIHMIEHIALHLGHMQLTIQLWQAGRGVGE